MNIFYIIYRVLTVIILPLFLFPFLIFVLVTGKYRKYLCERFGFLPDENLKKIKAGPKIWIHAVSLGELKVANSIINSLKEQIPDGSIILSTTTEHGRDLAVELLGDKVQPGVTPLKAKYMRAGADL